MNIYYIMNFIICNIYNVYYMLQRQLINSVIEYFKYKY